MVWFAYFLNFKVSAITDQAGMLDAGANLADLDDDEGSGLVSLATHFIFLLHDYFSASSVFFLRFTSILGILSVNFTAHEMLIFVIT